MASGGWSQKENRKIGSAGNHYRVGCVGRHSRGPGWRKPSRSGRRKAFEKGKRDAQRGRVDQKSEKKSNSGGIRRNTRLCERRKITEFEEEKQRTFIPSAVGVPPKFLFRGDRQGSEKTHRYWQLASVVVNEGHEAQTTNLRQKCFNKHLQAKGEEPLRNVKWRQVVEKKAFR